jgi:4-hydroxy-3-methylbut-2-enyl diphosphate reductase
MKVIRAEVLGFCMGVRRAVDLASTHAEQCAGKAYSLGPLIHNPQALEDLKRRGVTILDESRLPEDLNGAAVIIRAHGISPQTEAELRKRGADIIDATCLRVKASQLKAAAFAEAGYRLFLAGEESHAEISGIRGYAEEGFLRQKPANGRDAKGRCIVVGSAAEAEEAAAKPCAEKGGARTALIGQTTISPEEYSAIGAAIARYFPDVEILQTICAATKERQDSLRELLGKVEAVVIAGGKDSANTRRLLAIAEAAAKPCILAETAADIPPEFFTFAAACEAVGLAAGASTPDSVIEAIECALMNAE